MIDTMPQLRFYHHERLTVMHGLSAMLKRCMKRHDKAIIYNGQHDSIADMSDALWAQDNLPHGLVNEDFPDLQPILLSHTIIHPVNDANVAFFVNIHAYSDDEIALLSTIPCSLICILFHNNDDGDKMRARQLWKDYKDKAHLTLSYHQQNAQGGWDNKA